MNPMRRKLLQGLAAFGAAPAVVRPEAMAGKILPLGGLDGPCDGSPQGAGSVIDRELRRQFRAATQPHWDRETICDHTISLLGGLPPHLAALQSTSPTWRAQRGARHRLEQRKQSNRFTERMRAKFFGEDDI